MRDLSLTERDVVMFVLPEETEFVGHATYHFTLLRTTKLDNNDEEP